MGRWCKYWALLNISALRINKKIKIIAFEPSSSNIRILTRNISINNFSEIINVNQIALTDKKNVFLNMNEPEFIEGSSLNTFGENFNYEGKNSEVNKIQDIWYNS